jgi:hypothetical protein
VVYPHPYPVLWCARYVSSSSASSASSASCFVSPSLLLLLLLLTVCVHSVPGAPYAAVTHELRPNGGDAAVTNENKLGYIHAVADFHLNSRRRNANAAFLRGLSHVVHPGWLRLFGVRELSLLMSGGDNDGRGLPPAYTRPRVYARLISAVVKPLYLNTTEATALIAAEASSLAK